MVQCKEVLRTNVSHSAPPGIGKHDEEASTFASFSCIDCPLLLIDKMQREGEVEN